MRIRKGFTVVELILAVALSAVIALETRRVVNEIVSARTAFDGWASSQNANANGHRFARRLLMSTYRNTDSASVFVGDAHGAQLSTLCVTAAGTRSRCRVRLWTRNDAAGTSLFLSDGLRGSVFVSALVGEGRLTYLTRFQGEDIWLDEWQKDELPVAIAFTTQRDTQVFAIGYR